MSERLEAELLEVAREAAGAAAAELRSHAGAGFGGVHAGSRLAGGLAAKSTPTDLVSEADLAAEGAIRAVLAARRPDDAVLGEEGGLSGSGSGSGPGAVSWIVDPLDGTINYLYGVPAYCVSVACEDSAGPLVGVVLDPLADELHSATRSGREGPLVNGAPWAPVPRAATLDQALVATGFAYEAAVRAAQAEVLLRVLPRVRDLRRVGSAALDLCWTARGRFDAYFERGVQPWDVAAGRLIAAQAGLTVRSLPAEGRLPAGILVAPPEWIDDLHGLVAG